jgi:hypothetical protein
LLGQIGEERGTDWRRGRETGDRGEPPRQIDLTEDPQRRVLPDPLPERAADESVGIEIDEVHGAVARQKGG